MGKATPKGAGRPDEPTIIDTPRCKKCGSTNLRRDSTTPSGYRQPCYACVAEEQRQRRIAYRQSNLGRSGPDSEDALKPGMSIEERGNEKLICSVDGRIRTLEDLLNATKTDLDALNRDGTSEWVVEHHRVNKYEQMAVIEKQITYADLWQVKASLKRRTPLAVLWPEIKSIEVRIPTMPPREKRAENGLKRALIIPDSQHGYSRDLRTSALDPFHDRHAIDVAIQIARDLKPDVVVLLGDHVDLPDWSDKFVRSPDFYFTTQPALYELAYDLGRLRQAVGPTTEMHYLLGNHEARMDRAVFTNLIAAAGLQPVNEPIDAPALISIERLLGLQALGIKISAPYPDGEVWLNQNLVCVHGDIARNSEGATARAILAHTRVSVVHGHTHRIEEIHTTHHGPKGGSRYLAASPGTVARIDGRVPGRSKRNNWQQGVGVVEYESGDGLFHLDIVPIHQGRAIWRGHTYVGRFDLDALRAATKWDFHA